MRGLTTLELQRAVSSKRHLARDLGFLGVFPKDLLPRIRSYPCCVIANIHLSWKSGQHWVVLLVHRNGSGEFFDSMGYSPAFYGFHRWFPSQIVSYSRKQIQRSHYACGYFCLYFIFHKANRTTLYISDRTIFTTDYFG